MAKSLLQQAKTLPQQPYAGTARPANYTDMASDSLQKFKDLPSDSLPSVVSSVGNSVVEKANPRPRPVRRITQPPTVTISENLKNLLYRNVEFDANKIMPELNNLEKSIDKQIEQKNMAVISQESFLISFLQAYKRYYLNSKVVWGQSILLQLADPENRELILKNLEDNPPKGEEELRNSQIELLRGYLDHPEDYNDVITEIVSEIFDEEFKEDTVNKKMIAILSKLADHVPIEVFQNLTETQPNLMMMMKVELDRNKKSPGFITQITQETILQNLKRLIAKKYTFTPEKILQELDKLEKSIDKQIEQKNMAVISQESFISRFLEAYNKYYSDSKEPIVFQVADPITTEILSEGFDNYFKEDRVNKKMIEILSKLADHVNIKVFKKIDKTKTNSNLIVMMLLELDRHKKSLPFVRKMKHYLNSKSEL